MKYIRFIVACSLLTAATLMLAPAPACAGDCGIKPIKPIPPIGCKDLEAQCQCDENGNRCRWVWLCVKN